MYAIASLFDPASSQAIHDLWVRFEEHCGLVGVLAEPLPHISWMGADSFLFPPLEEGLSAIAAQIEDDLTIRAAGVGIFTGPTPVVYVQVVRDAAVMTFHERVWDCARPYAVVPNPYYHPDRWVPHVTLAYHQIEASQLGCAIADIAFQRIEMEIKIINLAIITNDKTKSGVRKKFEFGGG